jgi:hypothetical protein
MVEVKARNRPRLSRIHVRNIIVCANVVGKNIYKLGLTTYAIIYFTEREAFSSL